MGPEYWKPGSPTALKKCSERRSNDCDPTETDGCCAVIPCAYCIEWDPEEGDTVYAAADFATNGWSASIAGVTWFGSWQRNYDTNECEFVVTLDDVEIYRKSCYEGQSCRDSSDSASATISEVSGVITWTKYEPRPLEYIQDPDTNCTTYFCDDCECSCECLCVTITDETNTVIASGEICDVSYPCDGPVWSGTVGDYVLSLALGRDQYGDCIITATVDEVEQPAVPATGCGEMTATITLADDTVISVRCKKCSCEATEFTIPCCGEIAITAEALNARLEGIEAFGPEGQFSSCTWEGSLPLILESGDYFRTWGGIIPLTVNGGCTNCCDDVVFFLLVSCDGTEEHQLCVSYWYANSESGYTLTPIEDGNTGWIPGTGHETEPSKECSPLSEFVEGTEDSYASCSPLMMYSGVYSTHRFTISELALP